MLTPRAWWFLGVSLLVLLLGLGIGSPALTLTPADAAALVRRRMAAVRRAHPARRPAAARWSARCATSAAPSTTLWAGRTFEVVVRLEGDGPLRLPYVAVADRPPFAVDCLGDPLDRRRPRRARRRAGGALLASAAAGRAWRALKGCACKSPTSRASSTTPPSSAASCVYRVLPVLVEGGDRRRRLKRDNQLPPPGIHRLRRPGSGSELLDLRDYLPGDPPKTIAWKVSARRDRLITKEFESEVPVRCTLFVDASNSVRVPSVHGKALGRLVEIAAAVLQANAGVRDLTGLCLFDDHEAKAIRPDRSPAHVTAGAANPGRRRRPRPGLGPHRPRPPDARGLCLRAGGLPAPDAAGVNAVPFWQEWFDTSPGYSRRRVSLIQYLFRRKRDFYYRLTWLIPRCCCSFDLLLVRRCVSSGHLPPLRGPAPAGGVRPPSSTLSFFGRARPAVSDTGPFRPSSPPRPLPQAAGRPALRALRPGAGRPVGAAGGRRRLRPAGQRFLGEHQVPYTLPLYDRDGRYLFARRPRSACWRRPCCGPSAGAATTSCSCCWPICWSWTTRSTRCSRRCAWRWAGIIRWWSSSRGRRACGRRRKSRRATTTCPATLRVHPGPGRRRGASIAPTTASAATFTRLGVQVVCAVGEEPVPLILERLNRLRAAGRRR